MLNLWGIVAAILKMVTARKFSMSGINLGHHTHIWNVVEIGPCWIGVVLWWLFWKWRPLEIFQCRESIRDIIIYPHMKCRWNRTMLNLCGFVVAILKMVTARKIFNVGNKFGSSQSTHISNLDDIGQCWIFAVLWWPFWKWRPVEIFQCQESIWDIIIYPHIKF